MLAWEDSSRRTSLKSRRRVLQAFDSPPPSLRELEGDSRGTQTTRGDSRGTRVVYAGWSMQRLGMRQYTPVESGLLLRTSHVLCRSSGRRCRCRRVSVGCRVLVSCRCRRASSRCCRGCVGGAASGGYGGRRCFALGVLSVCSRPWTFR